MKHITIGFIAHVDAGKTTLSEAVLYESKAIRKLGRVDEGDSWLDNDEQERERGITIFSKQAEFIYGDTEFTLLDTPGHIDFAAEMERCLQVLDYAVLVISGTEGVQSHTRTLWRLLKNYDIPTFIFVNKMDRAEGSHAELIAQLRAEFSDAIIDMNVDEASPYTVEKRDEEIAVNSSAEEVLEQYMNAGYVSDEDIAGLVASRNIYPCYFGSALKLHGIGVLLDGLDTYTVEKSYPDEFGARVYKITRDDKGNRLTHIKIMGGKLSVRDIVCKDENGADEKVNQIRIYNGTNYETCDTGEPGRVYAVTGLTSTYAGQGLGSFEQNNMELIEPVISYRMRFGADVSTRQLFPKLKQLEEELPELMLVWDERDESIYVKLMGRVQLEVMTRLIKERLGALPEFDAGRITYKETVANTVIGVGHFEPLRHYAEAHIRLEPGERGSGVQVAADCSEDVLDRNWQRLIMTHLRERSFVGTAVGGQLTDVKLTVVNGRAHTKHTEGGDFRQATYRAVRQGLMEAENVVLEPYYNFVLDIPENMIGRAMTDIENRFGTMEPPEISGQRASIRGYAPVATLRDYQENVYAYTSGTGSISVSLRGYDVCHNPEEVIAEIGYDAEQDMRNPSSSVFCAQGSGFIVPWDQVKAYMHVQDEVEGEAVAVEATIRSREKFDYTIGLDEIEEIYNKTFSANKKSGKAPEKNPYKRRHEDIVNTRPARPVAKKDKLLIVDGYNVIFAWDELKSLAVEQMQAAKDKLVFLLANYRGATGKDILIVFDGYKVKGNKGSSEAVDGVQIVHTKEGETADAFIERYTHEQVAKLDITVATSDGLIQTITRGNGCRVISSRELYAQLEQAAQEMRRDYNV